MKQDKITIHGPQTDGTYIVEFKTAEGVALAFSVPKGSGTAVLEYFQDNMPTGSRCRMFHGPFQEPFTGQRPFSKHPAVARDGPGLAISTVTRDGAGGREIAAVGKAVLELALPDRLDGSKCAD